MQQAGMRQGVDAGEQKWEAAVGPGAWGLQEAETVRPVAAAAVVVAAVVAVAAVVVVAVAAVVVVMTAF